MRRWLPVASAALVLALAASLQAIPASRATFVELDVVALDERGQPVGGLHAQDFTIKEDGHPVAVTTFREVNATGIGGREDGRSLLLLLDDTPLIVPDVFQSIATRFLNRARPNDSVDVVRLTHQDDEISGNRAAAVDRVAEFKTGAAASFGRNPADATLRTVTRVSRSLQSVPHRRQAVVCIGLRIHCDPYLGVPEDSILWHSWRDAIRAAADAHASVYVVDVAGNRGGSDLGSGLVEETGGEAFVRSNDFDRAADLIWEQTGHYYLLGYTPTAKPRDLHAIDVSIARAGVHPLARKGRGD